MGISAAAPLKRQTKVKQNNAQSYKEDKEISDFLKLSALPSLKTHISRRQRKRIHLYKSSCHSALL